MSGLPEYMTAEEVRITVQWRHGWRMMLGSYATSVITAHILKARH